MKSLLALFLLALIVPTRAEQIASRSFPGGTTFKIHAPIPVLPSGGFFPVRIEIRNQTSKPLSWNVGCLSRMSDYGYFSYRGSSSGEGAITSNFGVSCPAGEERKIDLLIPINQLIGSGSREVTLRCSEPSGDYPISGSFSVEGGSYKVGISGEFAQKFEGEISSRFSRSPMSASSSYSSGYPVSFGQIDVERLPEDWRAYSGYDALAFTRQDLVALNPGVKLALDQWVRSGGNFITINDGVEEVPPYSIDGLGVRNRLDYGIGYSQFDADALLKAVRIGGDSLSNLVETDYQSGAWPVGNALGTRTVSQGLLFFALIIFAIVVGPVNLFFWANKHRRHRLFVTTPLISIAASLLMVGYIVIRDGFGGDGARAIAIEVGGPDDKSAVILQEQFSRSGILFSAGFEVDNYSVLNPVVPPTSDLNLDDSASARGTYKLSYAQSKEGWELSGDLFQSRSEQAQVIKSVVPSRERLDLLTGNSESPRLVSSFSYPLTNVYYKDGDGNFWKASAIAPGETVTMTASTISTDRQGEISSAISRFGHSQKKKLSSLLRRPNSFVALATEAPSISTHTSIDWMETPTLVTGLLSQ